MFKIMSRSILPAFALAATLALALALTSIHAEGIRPDAIIVNSHVYLVTVTYQGHVLQSGGLPIILDDGGAHVESMKKIGYAQCAPLQTKFINDGWSVDASQVVAGTATFDVQASHVTESADALSHCFSGQPGTVVETWHIPATLQPGEELRRTSANGFGVQIQRLIVRRPATE